jgi:glutaconate CoA-transferase subunit A
MDKRMSAADVVAQLRDGMTIGIGGWGPRRKPMALVREILRSDLKDLTIVSYGGADPWTLFPWSPISARPGSRAPSR